MKTRLAMGNGFKELRGEVEGTEGQSRVQMTEVTTGTRGGVLNLKSTDILGHLTSCESTILGLFSPDGRNRSLFPGHNN